MAEMTTEQRDHILDAYIKGGRSAAREAAGSLDLRAVKGIVGPLTDDEIVEIYRAKKRGELARVIADRFGVTQQTVFNIAAKRAGYRALARIED